MMKMDLVLEGSYPLHVFILQTQKAEVFYWKVDNPELFTPNKLPWLASESGIEQYYVFPIFEYPGLIKVIYIY